MTMFDMTYSQHQLVYNSLSFTLACMMATTVFLFLRVSSIHEKYKSAVVISGLVTFIAMYHYIRIFNSWVDAYEYPSSTDGADHDPVLTGVPFNDAYRYMDWLLTVPLLLIEIVLCQKLTEEETSTKSWNLGVASALMIAIGYPGELLLDESELGQRWTYWGGAMLFFLYIVNELINGLAESTKSEEDDNVRDLLYTAQRLTVFSWLTYPVVYIFPMMGFAGASAVVNIQIGYCISDVISKCGVGLVIYKVTNAKSEAAYIELEEEDALEAVRSKRSRR